MCEKNMAKQIMTIQMAKLWMLVKKLCICGMWNVKIVATFVFDIRNTKLSKYEYKLYLGP